MSIPRHQSRFRGRDSLRLEECVERTACLTTSRSRAFKPRGLSVFDGDDLLSVTCDTFEWVSATAEVNASDTT